MCSQEWGQHAIIQLCILKQRVLQKEMLIIFFNGLYKTSKVQKKEWFILDLPWAMGRCAFIPSISFTFSVIVQSIIKQTPIGLPLTFVGPGQKHKYSHSWLPLPTLGPFPTTRSLWGMSVDTHYSSSVFWKLLAIWARNSVVPSNQCSECSLKLGAEFRVYLDILL